jgi:hypothetical protein
MNKRIVFEALGRVWSFRLNAIKNGYGPVGRLLGSRAAPKV